VAPTSGVLALRGDVVPIQVVANDDGTAQVRLIADVDGNLATTGDQTVVFGPVTDANGALVVAGAATATLTPGAYTLFLTVDDGFNVASATLAGPFVVVVGRASVAPNGSATYGVSGTRVVFSVGEAASGGVSLNPPDVDAGDGVLGTLDAVTGTFTQHTVSTDSTGLDGAGTARRLTALSGRFYGVVREQDQGFINADPDNNDLHTWSATPATPAVAIQLFAGLVPFSPVRGIANRVLCTLVEAQEGVGGTVLNGDGDTLDTTIAMLVDPGAQLLRWPLATVAGPIVRIQGTRGAVMISEAAQGQNLNADADMVDTLIAVLDLNSVPPLGNLATPFFVGVVPPMGLATSVLAGPGFDVSADARVGYYIDEAAAGVPINGDADAIDQVPAIWNFSGGPTLSLPGTGNGRALSGGPAPRFGFYQGTKFIHTAVEDGQAPLQGDNNDGDILDLEILRWTQHTVDPTLSTVLAPGLPGPLALLTGLALDGGAMAEVASTQLAVVIQEGPNNNLDVSGEGQVGLALLIVDTSATPPVVTNTGLCPQAVGQVPLTGVSDNGTGIVVAVNEAQNGGDLNGDADASDLLFFFVPFAAPGSPVLLGPAGPDAWVVGGRVGMTANEQLAGTDLNLDGDALDFCFRVVSTAGAVQLAGMTCAQNSVPTADDGTLWAFLRNENAEVLDLNGDGDQLDFVVGFWRP
jgi:hypothetical protein